jgi:hypothetical protein
MEDVVVKRKPDVRVDDGEDRVCIMYLELEGRGMCGRVADLASDLRGGMDARLCWTTLARSTKPGGAELNRRVFRSMDDLKEAVAALYSETAGMYRVAFHAKVLNTLVKWSSAQGGASVAPVQDVVDLVFSKDYYMTMAERESFTLEDALYLVGCPGEGQAVSADVSKDEFMLWAFAKRALFHEN